MSLDPAWIGASVAVVGAVVAVKPLRWAWRLLSGTHDLVADWAGRPEHNGLPATPGVMARLAEHEKLLGKLIAETEPNGGNSLRDVVARTAADVAGIKDEQARLREQIEKGEGGHHDLLSAVLRPLADRPLWLPDRGRPRLPQMRHAPHGHHRVLGPGEHVGRPPVTLTMADSITPGNLPGGYDAYLGYVDGSWPTAKALGARFPAARIVTLTVLGGDAVADGCDRETGDLSAASAVNYTQRRLAAGQWRPVIYASAANMGTVLAVLAAAKISRGSVRLLSAHYGAGEHICGPETCRLVWIPMDGTQWTDSAPGAGGSQIDASVIADDFFGTPAPAQEEHVIIKTAPPGDWEGTVLVTGKGTDGNIWQTKTDNGESWTVPAKQ